MDRPVLPQQVEQSAAVDQLDGFVRCEVKSGGAVAIGANQYAFAGSLIEHGLEGVFSRVDANGVPIALCFDDHLALPPSRELYVSFKLIRKNHIKVSIYIPNAWRYA